MNKVNLGNKYTHRLTLRLSDEQHEFLLTVSNMLGVSPSDYIRMIFNAGMVGYQAEMDYLKKEKGVGTQNENVETDRNNIV